MIQSLIKLTMVSKNVLPSPKYIAATKLYYSNQQLNDVIKKPEFENNICKAVEELKVNDIDFKLLVRDNRINCNYSIQILKSMQKLYKKNGIPLKYLTKSEEFSKICLILNKHLRKLDLNEAINILNVLNSLEVPSSSLIMESLLQLIRIQINNLSLQEIYFLQSVLKFMKPTHLNDAISIALVEVFKAQVEFQLDTENITELIQAFIFASRHVKNEKILEFIINEIIKNKGFINLNSAVVILLRLMKLQTLSYDYFKPLLNKVSNVIIDHAVLLNNSTVINILKQMQSSILHGNYKTYHPILIDKLVEVSLTKNYGLDQWLKILIILNSIRHVNVPLLEHLSNYFYEYPSIFAKFYPNSCSSILSGCACANYKPSIWNKLQNMFLNNIQVLDNRSLYSFAIDLAALDCYDSNLLQQIFTDFKITEYLSEDNCRLFHRLYYSVKLLHPSYSGPWPSNEITDFLNSWKSQKNQFLSQQSNFPLLFTLEKLVGGSTYVSTNVKINEVEEPIDHLILLQYEYPINVQSATSLYNNNTLDSYHNIEDFIIPSGIERVAVIFLKSKSYSRNLRTLKSLDLLRFKILEHMSYKVVPIYEDIWKMVSNDKQLSYLQSLIRIKRNICIDR